MDRRMTLLSLSLLLTACGGAENSIAEAPTTPEATETVTVTSQDTSAAPRPLEISGYRVVADYPHGTSDFTQGLFIADGVLYESTGRFSQSSLIRHAVIGDATAARRKIPAHLFGEGSTVVGDKIVSVTWQSGVGLLHNLDDLEPAGEFRINGEGWGLTNDGERLILSDGTNRLRFLDLETFEEIGSVNVFANGRPVPRINELEYVNGEVWANIWQTDVIVRIDPETGNVPGFIDMSGLYRDPRDPNDNVLNGIAYDKTSGRLFVTGKNWPKIFEIEIVTDE